MRAAFPGGATMGLFAVSLAFAGLCIIGLIAPEPEGLFTSFSLGATLTALFARAGGGMFTKGADVAADLVGKIIFGIPEDSPRNPAVLADWIGDMVNDCAGMGSDLIDSLIAFIFSAILLFLQIAGTLAFFPILFMIVGLFASIIGSYIISNFRFRDEKNANPALAINFGTYATYAIFVVLSLIATFLVPVSTLDVRMRLWLAALAGIVIGVIVGLVTDYFNNGAYRPVKETAEGHKINPALGIINSLVVGKKSVGFPMLGIAAATVFSFFICEPLGLEWGLIGISMCGLGLVANIGIILAVDAFGPIADNAQGIGSFAGFTEKELHAANKIDELGNTTAAWGKGIVILLTAVTSVNLIVATIVQGIARFGIVGLFGDNLGTLGGIGLLVVKVLAGAMIGAAIPWVFSASLMGHVKNIALKICYNIKKQTDADPGILEGKTDPDYQPPIQIGLWGSLINLPIPILTVLAVTAGLRFIPWFGPLSLIGYMLGGLISGTPLAIYMANAGGNADNGKKICEAGELGPEHGKGSQTHKNAVVGDTVGDPLKDTGGPSINGIQTLMNLLTLFLFLL
jgi:K(+)-stimulated pyrophosphate-energized sodium pump